MGAHRWHLGPYDLGDNLEGFVVGCTPLAVNSVVPHNGMASCCRSCAIGSFHNLDRGHLVASGRHLLYCRGSHLWYQVAQDIIKSIRIPRDLPSVRSRRQRGALLGHGEVCVAIGIGGQGECKITPPSGARRGTNPSSNLQPSGGVFYPDPLNICLDHTFIQHPGYEFLKNVLETGAAIV